MTARPGRYNTDGILARLERDGFIHESDLTWLEKRHRKLFQDNDDLTPGPGDPGYAEQAKIDGALAELLLPCTGEAHSNAFIDNCMVCMPRWGHVINRERVLRKLSDAELVLLGRVHGSSPHTLWLQDNERDAAERLKRYGFVELVGRTDEQAKITAKGTRHLVRTGEIKDHECESVMTRDGNGAYCRICSRTLA